jgi:glycosyltransferase involved in cell wall biosynthesis
MTAYAFAKPVVATKVGGIPEVVEEGRTGFLVPPRNPQGLADALSHLLMNRPLRDQMSSRISEKIRADFSWNSLAEKTVTVYQAALRRAANAGMNHHA